jgi:hypothetical protein
VCIPDSRFNNFNTAAVIPSESHSSSKFDMDTPSNER